MLTNKWLIIFLIAGVSLLFRGPGHVAAGPEDARIKALYLYNFLLFVDWPSQAFGTGDPIRLTIAGDDDLFATLRGMGHMSIKGRDLLVERFASAEDLPLPCRAVFIGKGSWDLASRIIERFRGRSVLTVSDMPGFARMGGMVCFKHIGCKEHASDHPKQFEINLPAMKRAGLKIRSRLLRLTDIVE